MERKKNKKHVCFIRAAACRSQDLCAGIYSVFYFKWRDTKAPSHFRVNWSGQSKEEGKKKLWKELISTLCFFNAPVPLFPLLKPFTPPPPQSFPTRLRQEELALVPPFLHAFQGYPSASFSPPVSVWCPASLQPSLFVPFQSLCPHSSFHLHFSALIPLSIPTGPSWPQCREPNCSWPCHRLEGSWHPTAYKLSVRSLSSWFDKIQAISNSLKPSYFYPLSVVVFL